VFGLVALTWPASAVALGRGGILGRGTKFVNDTKEPS
jgi:hypothetical protein